mmetsp:Transcript_78413/g.210463  ORF Transcript_78413/g.210463 Transcript_78413/m.210463 type:complete len:274 (-) Transcript_78413:7-828(-)
MLVSALSLRGFRLSPSTTSDRDSLNFDTVCRISRMSLTVSCTLRTESVTFALYLRRSLWACSLVKRGTFGRCEAQSLRIIASLAPSALRWRIHIFMRLRSEALWSCSSTLFSIRVISSSGSSACHFASRSPWRMSLSFCLHHFPQKSGVLTAARQDAPLGKSSAMSSTPSPFLSNFRNSSLQAWPNMRGLLSSVFTCSASSGSTGRRSVPIRSRSAAAVCPAWPSCLRRTSSTLAGGKSWKRSHSLRYTSRHCSSSGSSCAMLAVRGARRQNA